MAQIANLYILVQKEEKIEERGKYGKLQNALKVPIFNQLL